MANGPIVMRETRYHEIKAVLARLRLDASARLVVLVDKDGQQIAVHGELGDVDTTSLASLAAGNVAATGGMAKLIGEREFPTLSHEGERERIHISLIGRVGNSLSPISFPIPPVAATLDRNSQSLNSSTSYH